MVKLNISTKDGKYSLSAEKTVTESGVHVMLEIRNGKGGPKSFGPFDVQDIKDLGKAL